MTRKKQHEKAPAADQPEAVAPDGASEQPEQQAPALVADADRGAAEAGAAEQPGAPADAGDGSGLGVDAGVQDGAGTAVAVEAAGQDGEPLTEAEVDAALAEVMAKETAENAPSIEEINNDAFSEDHVFSEDLAVDNAVTAAMAMPVSVYDGCYMCYSKALFPPGAADDLAELIRKIGPAATPEVLAQHLRLKKHCEPDAPGPLELATLKIFMTVLTEIDAFRKAAAKAAEEAMREAKTPAPLPIDETTLEPVDGPFDTW